MTSSNSKSLGILVAVGLLVRLALLFTQSPIFWPDSPAYFNWALKLAAGDDFINHTVYRTPGFPFLLAIILKLSDDPGFIFLVSHYLLGILGSIVVLTVFRNFTTNRVALLSALLFSINPLQLYYETVVQTECLFTFLFVCWLWAAVRFHREPSASAASTLGAITAALALTRPLGQLLIVIPLLLMIFSARKSVARRLQLAGLTILTYVLLVTPWLLHNRELYGHTGLSIDLGLNVYHRAIDKNLLPIPEDREYRSIARPAMRERLKGKESYITVMHILHRTGNTWVEGDRRMLNFAIKSISLAPWDYLLSIPEIFVSSLFFPDPSPEICHEASGATLCNHAHHIRQIYTFPNSQYYLLDSLKAPTIVVFQILSTVFRYFVPLFIFGVFVRYRRLGRHEFLRTDGLLILCILYFTSITAIFNSPEDRFRLPFEAILLFYLASLAELFQRRDQRNLTSPGVNH